MFFVFKPGTSLGFFIRSFILFLFTSTLIECLYSLLWSPGGTSRAESLLYDYIAGLYLSYYSSGIQV